MNFYGVGVGIGEEGLWILQMGMGRESSFYIILAMPVQAMTRHLKNEERI
jgi:hypothetical protein